MPNHDRFPGEEQDDDFEELEREPFADDWSFMDADAAAEEERFARPSETPSQPPRAGHAAAVHTPRAAVPLEARENEPASGTPASPVRPEPPRQNPAPRRPQRPLPGRAAKPVEAASRSPQAVQSERSESANRSPEAGSTATERVLPATTSAPPGASPLAENADLPQRSSWKSRLFSRLRPARLPRIRRPSLPRPHWPKFRFLSRRSAAVAPTTTERNTSRGRSRSRSSAARSPSLFFRVLAALPGRATWFGRGEKRPARRRRRRSERRPRIIAEGLSLDDKLDILGVLLVIAAVVLTLSALSANPGALIGPINDFLGHLLGQGALAAPITMFALGVWLILRYFGEAAPLMDLRRGAGALLLYLSLLTILQFFETFTAAYAYVDLAEPATLRVPLELTWTLKRAGGWLGTQLYLLLVMTVGELGALFVVLGAILLGLRFASEVSTYEMARWLVGSWRGWADQRAARQQARAIAEQAAAERVAAERVAAENAAAALPAAPTAPRTAAEGATALEIAPAVAFTPAAVPPTRTPHPVTATGNEPLPEPMRNGGRTDSGWRLPDSSAMLSGGGEQRLEREVLRERAQIIEDTLRSFGAPGRVVAINSGPVITQFGVEPLHWEQRSGKRSRVKVGAIAQLEKDIQLALGARTIRVEAPVPGKGYVGIEVPNKTAALVSLRDVMDTDEFRRLQSPLAIALGQRVDGRPVVADLIRMPHLLIAGTTGSGKSVCVNAVINSILLHNAPQQVRLLMVDPKRVELANYNGLPHLISPVVVEMERTVAMLKWVASEMDQRYHRFSKSGARHIDDYNEQLAPGDEPLPYIVVVIDELADLMMTAPEITERLITRIAALARATGIHLVIATQRPSVDVVTGLIKANFPARIAFAVASSVDSRVILDQPGAERLLGRGDMLFQSGEAPAPLRMQGVFVSDQEIENILAFWRAQGSTPLAPNAAFHPLPGTSQKQREIWQEGEVAEDGEELLYLQAVALVRRLKKASVSLLQRRMRIGYNRAARLIDRMEAEGIVGPPTEGSKPRAVLSLPEEITG
ncbi:MAG: DNA translocase FtsK [Chloroflexi bacterium]|nr:DNA translocase FtsK [Chloroflexota bacterium]